MSAIDAHMGRTRALQLEALESAQTTLVKEADESLAHVHSLLPSYHEDIALVEALEALRGGAKRRAEAAMAENSRYALHIAQELDRLQALLDGSQDVPEAVSCLACALPTQTYTVEYNLQRLPESMRAVLSASLLLLSCGKGTERPTCPHPQHDEMFSFMHSLCMRHACGTACCPCDNCVEQKPQPFRPYGRQADQMDSEEPSYLPAICR